jgi:scyllo-inositol 2-dehydrogenase (NADP+)
VGEPKTVLKSHYLLPTAAEGQGSIFLSYDELEAVIMYSKIPDSPLPSDIQGENGIIEIDRISDPEKIIIKYKDGSVNHEFDTIYFEVGEFIKCVKNKPTIYVGLFFILFTYNLIKHALHLFILR